MSFTCKEPKLRFKEFSGEWKAKKIKSILRDSRLGGNYGNSEKINSNPLIKMGNLGRGKIVLNKLEYIIKTDKINELDRINYGDLFFNTRNTLDLVGKVAIWRNELARAYYNSNLMWMKYDNNFFMNYRFNSYNGIKQLRKIATGTTSVAAIYTKDLLKVALHIPSKQEQEKIASFLSSVDVKIEQLSKKKILLEQYKKGVMQKIFSQKIRFRDDDENEYPEWAEKKLGTYLNHKSERNKKNQENLVLSVSNKKGFITQDEQFDGYEVASKDLSNYKIVYKNEYAYNPSRINVGSIARLKNFDAGIVSPMYVIFQLKSNLNPVFFDNLYNTHKFKHLIKIGCSGSVRDSLNFDDMANFDVRIPSIQEQTKIANFLSSIDEKLLNVEKQLDATKQFKKALLQQMFV